jgi:checkpoint serine/threonine-protein kinase
MTPIAERTESLGFTNLEAKQAVISKTPSKGVVEMTVFEDNEDEDEAEKLDSSPFQEIVNEARPVGRAAKIPQPALGVKSKPLASRPAPAALAKDLPGKNKSPIIADTQCNPVDPEIREKILKNASPPLSAYEGFFDHSDETRGEAAQLKKFVKALMKAKAGGAGADKTSTNLSMPPVLKFPGTDRQYLLKRELGAGAFAPVYLLENIAEPQEADQDSDVENIPVAKMGRGEFDVLKRRRLEALKMEDPPTAWEFYMMSLAHRRLGVSRASESLVRAYEMHLYADECYLIEEYREQGTLLDVVNTARVENVEKGGVMDEVLAMFFAVELLRTVEGLHKVGILHGDFKADNVLLRLDALPSEAVWSSNYRPDGTQGWSSKGIALIDFGRAIDTRAFVPNVGFIADWKTGPGDCAEMREFRPWTHQIDYHGLAGIIHTLLFGKYIDTVADTRAGGGLGTGQKRWRIREGLKRYWQQEIWGECFDLLLNPTSHVEGEEGGKMPVLKGMKSVREKMEGWLVENGEKGVGLQSMLRRLEVNVKGGKGKK